MPFTRGYTVFICSQHWYFLVKMRDFHRFPACHVSFQLFFAKLVTPILLHVWCEGLYLQVMEGFEHSTSHVMTCKDLVTETTNTYLEPN